MNSTRHLFKKYVTSVLLVAIVVTSYSPIQAIALNYWLERARSGASQAYDVLTRKQVWMPVAATVTVLCLLKMTYSGKKIWQYTIDHYEERYKRCCETVKLCNLDKRVEFLLPQLDEMIKQMELFLKVKENLIDNGGSPIGKRYEGSFNPSFFGNINRGLSNCSSNISHRLARRFTDVTDQVVRQESRIQTSLNILRDLKDLKDDELIEKFGQLEVRDGVLRYPDDRDNIKAAKR